MELSGEQCKEFCDALVDAFPDDTNLAMMVKFKLDEDLETIVGKGPLNQVTFKLIQWAEAQGRLEDLIRGAYKENPGNSKLKAFYQQATPKKEQLIDILELDFWEEHKNKILTIYKSSLPDRLIERDKTPETAAELIYDCLKFPQQENKSYSIIEKFVVSLLVDELLINNEILKEWRQNFIEDNIYNLIIKELKEDKQQKEQETPGLFVVIIKQKTSYLFKSWQVENIYECESKKLSDYKQLRDNKGDAEIETDETLSKVAELVRYWNNHVIEKDIKQIHIFLPYELMNHDVDCWKLYEGEENTIGEYSEVLIRCSERLRGNDPFIRRWKSKGEEMKNQLARNAANIFYLCDKDDNCLESQCTRPNAIGVRIATVFQKDKPGKILWKTGIPLALWIRKKLPNIDNETVLNQLIKGFDSEIDPILVRDIPRRVQDKRIESITYGRNSEHIGRNLCLLWDDPNLLPPQQQLTQNLL